MQSGLNAIFIQTLIKSTAVVIHVIRSTAIVLVPSLKKRFSYSNQLSTKFILLINVKMPTIASNYTCISMINTTSGRFKAIHFFIRRDFSLYEQLKFRAQLSLLWKKVL